MVDVVIEEYIKSIYRGAHPNHPLWIHVKQLLDRTDALRALALSLAVAVEYGARQLEIKGASESARHLRAALSHPTLIKLKEGK